MDEKTFAFIVDGDIFHFMKVPNDERFAGIIAGLQSKPQIIEVPEDVPLMQYPDGWRYVNNRFEPKPQYIIEDFEDYEVE